MNRHFPAGNLINRARSANSTALGGAKLMESFGKKVVLSMTIAVVLILGTIGTALGYTPPSTSGGTTPVPADTQCVATKADFDGNLTLVDATSNDVGIDFWWRGTDPGANTENWTMLRDGVFNNTYPALVGALWTYTNCTLEQVDQLFAAHVAERTTDLQNDNNPASNPGEFVPWDMTGIFVSMGDCQITTTPDGLTTIRCGDVSGTMPIGSAVNPDPTTVDPATTTIEPSPLDASVILAIANNDDRNPYDQLAVDDCQILADYFGLETEFATSGSYGIIGYPDELGATRVTLVPHMRAATGGPIDASVRTLDVNCSFGDALVEVQNFLQEKGLTTSSLINWKETGLFTEIKRNKSYFGIGNGSGNPTRCKVGLGHEGPIQRWKDNTLTVEENTWVHLQAWQPGGPNGEAEHETFVYLNAGESLIKYDNVGGWHWLYDARYCNPQEIKAQVSASINRRIDDEANTVGFVAWNHVGRFETVWNNTSTDSNPFPSWFRIVNR